MRFFNTTGPVDSRGSLLHSAAGAFRPGRGAGARPDEEVLRAARPPADGQDLLPAGALRPVERAGLRLRIHHRRDRAHGPRRRGAGDADGPRRDWARMRDRRWATISLAGEWSGILAEFGPSGALREALKRWAEASSKPLVLLIDEIDTLQGDPAALGAATATRRLPHASGRLSAMRGAVRAARRARLPRPFDQQPVQHRGEVACGWGTSRARRR